MAYIVALVVWLLQLSIRYAEKRWVPREGKAKLALKVNEEKASRSIPIAENSSQQSYAKNVECFSKEHKRSHPSTASNSVSQKVDIIVYSSILHLASDKCLLLLIVKSIAKIPFLVFVDRLPLFQSRKNFHRSQN